MLVVVVVCCLPAGPSERSVVDVGCLCRCEVLPGRDVRDDLLPPPDATVTAGSLIVT